MSTKRDDAHEPCDHMTVFFIVLNEMFTGIVPSQVIAPAREYAAAFPDLSVRIAFLEPARVAFSRRAKARLNELSRIWPAGRMQLYPYVGRAGKFSPAFTIAVVLRFALRNGSTRFLLHCRGPEATIQGAHAAKRLGGRVIFDARGASDHEAVLRLALQGRSADKDLVERSARRGAADDQRAAEEADAVVAVSQPLARRLEKMMNGAGKPVAVIPCCVEEPQDIPATNTEIRARLGVGSDQLLLVHVSSEARWEAYDQVIDFFREVHSRRASRLLFLTTVDPALVTASLAPQDPIRQRLVVQKARPEEVSHYLAAADVGLLLRRPHDAFRMASPIKFAEYLAAGLAVVVSSGLGTTGEVVEHHGVGVVIPASTETADFNGFAERLVQLIERDRDGVRKRSVETCRELFVWQRYTSTISQLYGIG